MPPQRPFIHRYFWPGLAAIVLVGIVVNLLVWFWPRQEPEPARLPSYPAHLVLEGRDLYRANCASCHGEQGEGHAQAGVPAPALDHSEHAWHHPDWQVSRLIREGGQLMPAVGPDWSERQIEAVLAYIKQWWEPEQLAYQTRVSQQSR